MCVCFMCDDPNASHHLHPPPPLFKILDLPINIGEFFPRETSTHTSGYSVCPNHYEVWCIEYCVHEWVVHNVEAVHTEQLFK